MLDNIPSPTKSPTVKAIPSSEVEPPYQTAGLAPEIRDEASFAIVRAAAKAADERKGGDIVCLDVGGVSVIADYFLVVTGYSTTQVKAIVRAIEEALLEELDLQPIRVEGLQEGSWVLMDYGDAIVHVQLETEREFYNLEAFWGHARNIQLNLQS